MTIGIIGFGRFGQLLVSRLQSKYKILVYRHKNSFNVPKNIKAEKIELKGLSEADVIILSLPIRETERMIKKISSVVKPGTLVMDVCSVKIKPVEWMKKYLPRNVEIAGTHPLFGPDSISQGMKEPPVVICPIRLKKQGKKKLEAIFSPFGAKIINTTPKKHDQDTAVSLALE